MLAFRWHPDRNPRDPGAAERFRGAVEAYETLVDPLRRGHYDRIRGYKKPRGGNGRRRGAPRMEAEVSSYDEILEAAFGIRNERAAERRSYDLRFDLQVSRSSALEGAFENIDYARWVFCQACCGKNRGKESSSCRMCKGNGEVEEAFTLRVWIPAGSEDGARVRIAGAGDWLYPGDQAGDLVIFLHVIDIR